MTAERISDNDPDPVSVEKVQMATAAQLPRVDPTGRLPGESSLSDEVGEIFVDPNAWMHQKHPMLAGRSPQESVDAGDEQAVWDLLHNIKYVGLT
jgi:hypothetical protein